MVTAESLSSLLMAAMREAVLIEREACAKIADHAIKAPMTCDACDIAAAEIAAAIRARQ
jgi:hypothetical protein